MTNPTPNYPEYMNVLGISVVDAPLTPADKASISVVVFVFVAWLVVSAVGAYRIYREDRERS